MLQLYATLYTRFQSCHLIFKLTSIQIVFHDFYLVNFYLLDFKGKFSVFSLVRQK